MVDTDDQKQGKGQLPRICGRKDAAESLTKTHTTQELLEVIRRE